MHMVRRFCSPLLSISFLSLILSASVFAEESAVYLWQKERLMNPNKTTLQMERQKNQVFIYEGLTLSDVEKALDKNFDRVEHMMFVGTVLPPTADGTYQKEEDGCD